MNEFFEQLLIGFRCGFDKLLAVFMDCVLVFRRNFFDREFRAQGFVAENDGFAFDDFEVFVVLFNFHGLLTILGGLITCILGRFCCRSVVGQCQESEPSESERGHSSSHGLDGAAELVVELILRNEFHCDALNCNVLCLIQNSLILSA